MKQHLVALVMALTLAGWPTLPWAGPKVLEDFSAGAENRWTYFADTVMGGISTGGVRFSQEGGDAFARLQGQVSTANNGGFIQIRATLANAIDASATGIRLVMRGNNQPYYIHLRTRGTRLPWQYYQAEFTAKSGWTEVRLPFSAFKPSSNFLRKSLRPETLRTLGIVAYGRDHDAMLDVAEIGTY